MVIEELNMWARIDSGKVAELTDIDPDNRFHPSLIWVECADSVTVGMLYVDGKFKPEPEPEPPTHWLIKASRLIAFADPLNGSDRYFLDAMREQSNGNTEAAEKSIAAGNARHSEIEAMYPWPE
jgi:hypothetical protein